MRIAGIVAEYNPFHNGHAYHIRRTRAMTGCDYVVVCMAGHFTQRGEPVVRSKWDRARMALSCGADAVFELPAAFALRPAEGFATGGVGVLGGVGVDALSFGSETADRAALERLATLRESEPPEFSRQVKAKLDAGMAHARAWGEVAGDWLGLPAGAINLPNQTLAIEYLRVMRRLFPTMEAVAVERIGDYHDDQLGEFASASAIRAAFERGEIEAALAAIPPEARPWALPDALHPMDDVLLYRLRNMTLQDMQALPGMSEGLEHRLYRLCREASGRDALLNALKCKRYTHARLSRLLLHAALELSQKDMDAVSMPPYARLLGARRDSGPLLRELKARATIPIVSDPAMLKENACFDIECRATDLWALLHDAPELRCQSREFRERFVSI